MNLSQKFILNYVHDFFCNNAESHATTVARIAFNSLVTAWVPPELESEYKKFDAKIEVAALFSRDKRAEIYSEDATTLMIKLTAPSTVFNSLSLVSGNEQERQLADSFKEACAIIARSFVEKGFIKLPI